jgi:hypothetical protein
MLQHEHFAKVRPHRHTSYASLMFMLVIVGVLLAGLSFSAQAAVPAVNPQSGSVGLSGRVPGPAPSVAATILTPRNGSVTTSSPVTIAGVCPANTFVTIEKNGVFGGVTSCLDDGTFSLQVDLFSGSNALIAQVSDALGQFGPNSPTVTVTYNAPQQKLSGDQGRPLFILSNVTVLGGSPGEKLSRSVSIVGGVAPYAVSWDFGDYATSLSSQPGDGVVAVSHAYERPGTYNVIVRVTDSLGNNAYLQLVTVVNGPTEAFGASSGNGKGSLPGTLVSAWPLYVLALVMVIFFWLGEKREVRKLRKKHLLA